MTTHLTPPASHTLGDAAAPSGSGPVTLAELPDVWIRHQTLSPFRMVYDGRRPMVIFLFNAAQPAQGGPLIPRGAHGLLVPGAQLSLQSVDPVETLAVGFTPRNGLRLPQASTPPPGKFDPGVRALAHELRRVLLTEGEEACDYVKGLATTLVTRAALSAAGTALGRPAGLAPLSLRRVQAHIDRRLPERITVGELAALTGLSRGYFSRAFLAATGESPHRFILSRRLTLARDRLDAGEKDLSRLAVQAGFSSHAHMTTAFRHAFGLTPQDYRRRTQAPDRMR